MQHKSAVQKTQDHCFSLFLFEMMEGESVSHALSPPCVVLNWGVNLQAITSVPHADFWNHSGFWYDITQVIIFETSAFGFFTWTVLSSSISACGEVCMHVWFFSNQFPVSDSWWVLPLTQLPSVHWEWSVLVDCVGQLWWKPGFHLPVFHLVLELDFHYLNACFDSLDNICTTLEVLQ